MSDLPYLMSSIPCDYPTSTTMFVQASIKVYKAKMMGFVQFGTLENPPRVYGSLTMGGSLHAVSHALTDPDHINRDHSVEGSGWGGTFSSSGVTDAHDFTYSFTDGITSTSGNGQYFVDSTYGLHGGLVKYTIDGTPITVGSGKDPLAFTDGSTETGFGNILADASPEAAIIIPAPLTISGPDTASIDVTGGTYGIFTVDTGSITFGFGDEDDDGAAVSRALDADPLSTRVIDDPGSDFGFSSGLYSLKETRAGTDAVASAYCIGKYWLRGSPMLLNVKLHAQVQFERRLATGNGQILDTGDTSGYGDWEDADLDDFTFTPDVADYTGAQRDIPSGAGYQYRIKSVTITPTC